MITKNEQKLEILHSKKYGKNTMNNIIIKGSYSTDAYAGSFYHYTSPEGLRGILGNRELFFTDAQFLNDYSERININKDLELFWETNRKRYDKQFLGLLNRIRIEAYEDDAFAYMQSDNLYGMIENPTRYYVFSTSTEPDSLNMWKYYSKSNGYDGYCIELFTLALVDEWIDKDTGVSIVEGLVIYSTEKKQEIIASAVDRLYKEWCKYIISNEFNEKIIKEYKSWISITSLFFKHECFAEEKEYRYIAVVPTSKLLELKHDYNGIPCKMYDFRIKNGVLIPYIKMPFNYYNVSQCYAVQSIGVGPSVNFEQKKLGIELFLKSLDFTYPNLSINQSKIPLRY